MTGEALKLSKKLQLIGQVEQMELYRLETEPFGTNAYLLIDRDSGESVLVDAPGDADRIAEKLAGSKVKYILMTHGHMDHIMVLEELQGRLGATLAAHEGDAGLLPVSPKLLLEDGDRVACGDFTLEVIHAPGHTAGSICFRVGKYLLSGDTIFPGGPGKTATPDDFRIITASIRDKIMVLPDETVILPGHGEATTVGREKGLFEAFSAREHDGGFCGDVTWEGA